MSALLSVFNDMFDRQPLTPPDVKGLTCTYHGWMELDGNVLVNRFGDYEAVYRFVFTPTEDVLKDTTDAN